MKLKAKFGPGRDGRYGVVGKYPINSDGTVEVDDGYGEWLLGLNNNCWDLVGAEPAEMIITNGDETINLMELDKPELMDVANKMDLDVNGRSSVRTIRDAIMKYVMIER